MHTSQGLEVKTRLFFDLKTMFLGQKKGFEKSGDRDVGAENSGWLKSIKCGVEFLIFANQEALH